MNSPSGRPADHPTSLPRLLQQQPERAVNRQQQQSSGDAEFQPQAGGSKTPSTAHGAMASGAPPERAPPERAQQMGEGVSDYQTNIKSYLKKVDVQAQAKVAKPVSSAPAKELASAEKEGPSSFKGRGS